MNKTNELDIYDDVGKTSLFNFRQRLGKKYREIKEARQLTLQYAHALWQWRQIKTHTDNVDQAINKEFMIDDTGTLFFKYSYVLCDFHIPFSLGDKTNNIEVGHAGENCEQKIEKKKATDAFRCSSRRGEEG